MKNVLIIVMKIIIIMVAVYFAARPVVCAVGFLAGFVVGYLSL